ncbi:aminodeoxychorismate synthase component I [Vibrio sp.]|nr:aminodeoxychorismate synthase component I [Vibrio sp.]
MLAMDLFSRVQEKPWSMLLRSAADNHPNSRFDILVHTPVVTLTTHGEYTSITTPTESKTEHKNPFDLLELYLDQYTPTIRIDTELPFVGGALGLFGYDLGRHIENMPIIAEKDLSTPDMMVGIYDWAIVVDHKLQKAYAVGVDAVTQYHSLLALSDTSQPNDYQRTSDWTSNMSQSSYADKFHQVQDYITAGDCYQINLAQRFSATYQGNEWHAYNQLEQKNAAPFSAFIRSEHGAILSVSPERFIQLNQNTIETKPIKGTRPRHPDPVFDAQNIQELKTAEKDQAENLMIVDLLRNDIGRVAKPGSVHVPHLFSVETFPAVHHLVSTIRATLDSRYTVVDLLKASFPGGSITGAPKIRAMEIIEELEPHRRNAYCGSIGYLSRHGVMDTSITIRTLVAENHTLYAWAGGGVVADSQCDSEYQETLDKLSKILPNV